MRKMSVIMLTVSLLAYTALTQLASAQGDWKENRVTNQTSETLYVTFSTWRAASGEVTATGYRTAGHYTIDPGDSRLFHAYKNNAIYFQILTSMTTYLKPQINTPTITIPTVGWASFDVSTDPELFIRLIIPRFPGFFGVLSGLQSGQLDLLGFNVVTRSLVDASIDFANVSWAGDAYIRLDDFPAPMDGFIKYTNGSQIIVTNEWVEINKRAEQEETLGKFAEQEETLGKFAEQEETLVNIPDPNLRRTILQRLNSAENAHISQADMKKLTGAFRASNKSIADLTGLEFAVNLKTLILSGNNISDIAPLRHLRADLIALALDGNPIFDIAPLENFPNLKTLVLSRNQITDIAPLRNLTKLETLRLIDDTGRFENLRGQKLAMWLEQGTSISLGDSVNIPDPNLRRTILQRLNSAENAHISQADMKKLTGAFRASNKSIADLTGLEFAVNLKTLILSGNNISDIAPLRHLRADLIALALDGNPIFDIAPLENFPNLKTLVLSRNQITDIAPLRNLTKLETLRLIDDTGRFENLRGQKLAMWLEQGTSIGDSVNIPDPNLRRTIAEELSWDKDAPISQNDMLTLTTLFAHFAEIRDLTGLEFATNLRELDLESNQISDISPLKNLKNLRELDLESNQISDISPLKNLKNLRNLVLSGNPISDVSSLKNLKNLERLELSDNQLSNISALKNLKNLREMWLSDGRSIRGVGTQELEALLGRETSVITDTNTNNIPSVEPSFVEPEPIGPEAIGPEPITRFVDNINIPDPALRETIANTLGKDKDAPISDTDMLNIIGLYHRDGIRNLTGLEFATNLERLWLDGSQIADLSPLKNLTNLRQLWLYGSQITDVAPLENLTNLISLNLKVSQITDVAPLENLTNLRSLELYGNQITDVAPLENLTNLRYLVLGGNQITDISSLKNLTNLTGYLFLGRNQITDVAPLENLTNVTHLLLEGNQITDVAPLENLTNLKYLELGGNQITDVAPLEKLLEQGTRVLPTSHISIPDPNLRRALRLPKDPSRFLDSMKNRETLKLSDKGIRDLTGLQFATYLEVLDLSNNQITDLSPLRNLTNLTILRLSNNQITDLSPLRNLKNLKYPELSNNQITDLSPLLGIEADWQALTEEYPISGVELVDNNINIPDPILRNAISDVLRKENRSDPISATDMLNLVYFDHDYQGLADLTGLEFALNLRELKTFTTQIVDLSPLKNLTNLTSLEFSDNQIADLSPLKNLTNLRELYLNNNQIADLSPLKNLTKLTILRLSNNQISDLSPLKNLNNLGELQLSDNQIVDISPLRNLTRLGSLTLNQNDISHILPLGTLTSLTTLELKNNLIWDIAPLGRLVQVGTFISFNTNKVRMPSGEASVDNINIPDPNLRRPIETALGKAENAPISDTDMLKLIRLEQPQAGIRDLIGLEFAINLQVLALQSSKIFDLSPLKDLTNLRTLRLLDNKISDLSPLKDLNNLTELDLFRNQIFDLSPLKNLNNLRELVLTRNGISDLSPITNLTNLTELGLGVNKISDLSSLKNLTNLISLDLFSNQISDISPLKDLTNLETLRLAVNPISDISPLKDLTNLKGLSFTARPGIDASVLEKLREQGMEFLSGTKTSATIYDQRLADAIRRELGGNSATVLNMKNIINLDLSDYGVQNLTGLEFAINLEVLNLENSQIASISPLKNLTKLRELNLGKNTTNYFHKNKISDISPLENLTNLTSLVLENNKVSDISSLKNLTKLSELNLNDNQIANVSSLRNLTNLTQLGLAGNQVADISTLRNLTNLTQLGLSGNQVADISTLRNLTNLTQLGLAGNQVADISTLRYLTNLTQLGLSGNQVADISTLRNLTNLTQLGLSGNQVADISTLRNLTNLTQLDLSGNQVADISTLRNLTNLTQLGLAGNQIANVSLLRYLTNLTQLDLGFNKIADVSTLRYLTKLTYLNLENNQITDLPQFENLTKLDTLILWNNYIYGARLSKRTRVWLLSLENLKYHLHLLEPSCDTTIPNFLEPLERVGVELQLEERQISTDGGDITVSTVKGAISQGKGPAWTLDETVFNDSTFLVLTVQLLGTDGAKRDNLDYLVGNKKKYNAAARVNPPSGMKELIEDVVYDWAETANIEFWFVDGSERDADIRIAFYDAEKLDPEKPENRRTSSVSSLV